MRFIALGLLSLLATRIATSQAPASLPIHDPDARPPARESAFRAPPSSFTPLASLARRDGPRYAISPSFTQTTGNAFLVVRAASGDIETPDQLLAALGMSNLSIRVSSWPAAGRGAKRGHTVEGSLGVARGGLLFARVDGVERDDYEIVRKRAIRESVETERVSVLAGTLGFVRDLRLAGADIGFGADVTLYRFDSRFDPVAARHPVSIQGFVRIRFGSRDTSRSVPVGHSMGM